MKKYFTTLCVCLLYGCGAFNNNARVSKLDLSSADTEVVLNVANDVAACKKLSNGQALWSNGQAIRSNGQAIWKVLAGDADDYLNSARAFQQVYQNKPSRRISLFLDGTANTDATNTNVWKLYTLATQHACHHAVIPYYQQGVGSSLVGKIVGSVAGVGIGQHIKDAYRFLVETYQPGDQIFIFGFSRGAYTARALNGMIEFAGLLKYQPYQSDSAKLEHAIDVLFDAYNVNNDGKPKFNQRLREKIARISVNYSLYRGEEKVVVDAVGVFDTVAALGLGQDDNPDEYRTDLYAYAGYHALALDEQRKAFRPLRFDDRIRSNQILRTVWFPGAHADVGGGYQDNDGLESVSRQWMLNQFERFRLFAAQPYSIDCRQGATCEYAYMHDEFLDNPLFNRTGLHIRRPNKGERIHGSLLCRYQLNALPKPNTNKEPDKRYRPENVYTPITQNYQIEDHACAR